MLLALNKFRQSHLCQAPDQHHTGAERTTYRAVFQGEHDTPLEWHRVEEVIAAQEPLPLSKDTTSWDSSLDGMELKAAANVLDNEQHAQAMAKVGFL